MSGHFLTQGCAIIYMYNYVVIIVRVRVSVWPFLGVRSTTSSPVAALQPNFHNGPRYVTKWLSSAASPTHSSAGACVHHVRKKGSKKAVQQGGGAWTQLAGRAGQSHRRGCPAAGALLRLQLHLPEHEGSSKCRRRWAARGDSRDGPVARRNADLRRAVRVPHGGSPKGVGLLRIAALRIVRVNEVLRMATGAGRERQPQVRGHPGTGALPPPAVASG